MKKINRFRLCAFTIICLFLILTNSCKKDDQNLQATVTDIDGNVYRTVTIGTQVWMVENLYVTHYRNGDLIPNISLDTIWSKLTTGALCDFNNIPNNSKIYGKLYNWYAVNDNRVLAPKGWHVATDSDWIDLVNLSGGEQYAGGKLKESGTIHWNNPNFEATNDKGFTALPGGSRLTLGGFCGLKEHGCWWTSSEFDTINSWDFHTSHNIGSLIRYYDHKNCGLSVRCIKDK